MNNTAFDEYLIEVEEELQLSTDTIYEVERIFSESTKGKQRKKIIRADIKVFKKGTIIGSIYPEEYCILEVSMDNTTKLTLSINSLKEFKSRLPKLKELIMLMQRLKYTYWEIYF